MPAEPCRPELLPRLLEDDVSEEERTWLESHLAECPKCRDDLERHAADTGLWKEAGEALPNGESRSGSVERNGKPATRTPPSGREKGGDPTLRQIARYSVEEWVGGGGFGEVYRCWDGTFQRQVAVKVTRPDSLPRGVDAKAYLAEASALGRVDHSCIVPVYDAGQTADGFCYLVFKYIAGGNLRRALGGHRWDGGRVCESIARVADALSHVHAQSLVHRDVKPSNILLDSDQQAYLADFGLACPLEQMTGPVFAGTVPYMSPEMARGETHRIDGRSDIFSLGVVMFEALTGKRLFVGDRSTEIVAKIAAFQPKPLREVDSSIPEELDRICFKALAHLPIDRYQNAADFAKELRAWASSGQTASDSAIRSAARRITPRGMLPFGPEDVQFYADLLPGPRDANGTPESIRIWKERLEGSPSSAEPGLVVGVVYGPSGAGKSSFLRAGLAPRLAGWIQCVQVDCTADRTEAAVVRAFDRMTPASSASDAARPAEKIAAFREASGYGRVRVLLVLDQFERWLAGWDGSPSADLVAALRQFDGRRLVALLVVRDEFWSATSRFLRALELPLADDRSSMQIEPFNVDHARHVLANFGRAYGRLASTDDSRDVEKFLDAAVNGLSVDGRVVPAQLSLIADLMKDSPWTNEELKRLGGVHGVFRNYLDGAFGTNAPKPQQRLAKAAKAVLEALLQDSTASASLAGTPKTREELLTASGLADRPADFDELITLLEDRLRLIKRIDGDAGDSPRYALAHDTLVRPVREWLDAEQGRTWRGRAQLKLMRLAAAYALQPEARNLPTWWEWPVLESNVGPNPSTRVATLMSRTRRRIGLQAVITSVLTALLIAAGYEYVMSSRATSVMNSLSAAEPSRIPLPLEGVDILKRWIMPRFNASIEFDARSSNNAWWGVFHFEPERAAHHIAQRIAFASPEALASWLPMLRRHRDDIVPYCRQALADSATPVAEKLRHAVVLANLDSKAMEWGRVVDEVVFGLTQFDDYATPQWATLLAPISYELLEPLKNEFQRHPDAPSGCAAATCLAIHQANNPTEALPLILACSGGQLARLIGSGVVSSPQLREALEKVAKKSPPTDASESAIRQSRGRANAAAALLALGNDAIFDEVVGDNVNPTARSYLYRDAWSMQLSADALMRHLWNSPETRSAATYGRLLCLGRLADGHLSQANAAALTSQLETQYRTHPDSGVHSACDWLLGKLGRRDIVARIDSELAGLRPKPGQRWFVNDCGVTIAIFGPNCTFDFGATNRMSDNDIELQRNRTIHYRFGVATRLATTSAFTDVGSCLVPPNRYPTSSVHPMNGINLSAAAEYCFLLTTACGLPPRSCCFSNWNDVAHDDLVVVAPGFLALDGYRLPIEEELEFVARAWSTTKASFGDDDSLASEFETYMGSGRNSPSPPGDLPPNAAGMFDPHGNLLQIAFSYDPVERQEKFVCRGASVINTLTSVRSAQRIPVHMNQRFKNNEAATGLRVAVTLPTRP